MTTTKIGLTMKNLTAALASAGILFTGGLIGLLADEDKPAPVEIVEYDPASLPACEGRDGLAGELPCLLQTPENVVVVQKDTSRVVIAER